MSALIRASAAVIADNAYALPGTVLVNADSHTCAAGAFNCAARGVGGPDMLYGDHGQGVVSRGRNDPL